MGGRVNLSPLTTISMRHSLASGDTRPLFPIAPPPARLRARAASRACISRQLGQANACSGRSRFIALSSRAARAAVQSCSPSCGAARQRGQK